MADIVWDIPHIRQQGKMDCWGASASMMLRRSVTEGCAGLGRFRKDGTRGLVATYDNINSFAQSHNLEVTSVAQSHSLKGISDMLKKGPLFVVGRFTPDPKNPKASGAFNHAYVIAGVRGHEVLVHNPSLNEKKWRNYSDLMKEQPYRGLMMLQERGPGEQPRHSLCYDYGVLSPARSREILKLGSRSEEVSTVQRMLGVRATGYYGQATKAAVLAFQKRNGLAQDGIVGKNTRGLLNDPLRIALERFHR